jgi:hypothetical protein
MRLHLITIPKHHRHQSMENDILSVIMKRFNLNDDAIVNGQQSIKLIHLIVQSNTLSM